MSDNDQQQASEKLTVKLMQNALNERSVASVILGDSGTVIVQIGDKITVFERDASAEPAACLLGIIAECQKLGSTPH